MPSTWVRLAPRFRSDARSRGTSCGVTVRPHMGRRARASAHSLAVGPVASPCVCPSFPSSMSSACVQGGVGEACHGACMLHASLPYFRSLSGCYDFGLVLMPGVMRVARRRSCRSVAPWPHWGHVRGRAHARGEFSVPTPCPHSLRASLPQMSRTEVTVVVGPH